MRKIIKGRAYDTEKATKLASAHGGGRCNDFSYWEETLYRTDGGAYFLLGEGGAMSEWARVNKDYREYGRGIVAVSGEDAQAWVEKHANSRYEEVFGKVEEA